MKAKKLAKRLHARADAFDEMAMNYDGDHKAEEQVRLLTISDTLRIVANELLPKRREKSFAALIAKDGNTTGWKEGD